MSKNPGILQMIDAENSAAFAAPLVWHSNGQRGHLHASAYCHKVKTHGQVTIHNLTLHSALERTICPECLPAAVWNDAQRKLYHAARNLDRLQANVADPIGGRRFSYNANTVLRDLHIRQTYRWMDASVEENMQFGLPRWGERLRKEIASRTPVDADPQTTHDALLSVAASATIALRLNRNKLPGYFWGTINASGHGPFGALETAAGYNGPLRRYAHTWASLIESGATPERAAADIVEDTAALRAVIGEPNQATMMRLSTDLPPNAGETMWRYAQRRWDETCRAALDDASTGMSRYYAALTAPAKLVLLANRNQNDASVRQNSLQGDVGKLLASLHLVCGHGKRCVVACHPTIAAVITSDGNYSMSEWSEPVEIDDIPSIDILETALTLWEPFETQGAYAHFSATLDAAKAL